MKAFTKKITAMAAVLTIMAAGVPAGSFGVLDPVGISASAETGSLTSSQIEGFQKDWKAHGWVLKKGFWANSSKTGKAAIKDAQRLLNFTINSGLDVDGQFGPATQKAVKSFQKKYGLTQDGIIGSGTWKKLISVAKDKIGSESKKDDPPAVNSGYDVEGVIAAAQSQLGMTGPQLGYTGDWCAYYASDLLRNAGVNISRSAFPRDIVISALNNGLGTFYCFRDENLTSLRNNGLSDSGLSRVVSTTRGSITPQRGDIVCFLFDKDNNGYYNWSHVGIVTGYDASTNTLFSIDGNTTNSLIVANRDRAYDRQVVGLLRL